MFTFNTFTEKDIMTTVNGNIVYHKRGMDKQLQAAGLIVAAAQKLQMFDGTTAYLIMTDNKFDEIELKNKKLAKFIMAHEVGHIVNGDLENSDTQFDGLKKAVKRLFFLSDQEVAADSYAIAQFGSGVNGPAIVYALSKYVPAGLSRLEVIKRANAQKNK